MSDSKVELVLNGAVALVRINDPATMNALPLSTVESLSAAVAQAQGSARALVLTGIDRAFSSGASLTAESLTFGPDGLDVGKGLETHYNPLMRQLRELSIPWISAVNGAAAGIGCSLALAADLIVAGESAYFLQAFRRIGLVPDGGSTLLLAQAAGRVRAMEMMLLGEKLPAAKALEWGLINRLVPDAEVESVALALAEELAAGPTVALGLIRKAAWAAMETSSWDEVLQTERTLQTQAGRTADFMEGVMAFREKRLANFRGA